MLQLKLMVSGIWTAIAPTLMIFLTTVGREALQIGLRIGIEAMSDPSLKTGAQRGAYVKDGIKAELPAASVRLLNIVGEVVANKYDPK